MTIENDWKKIVKSQNSKKKINHNNKDLLEALNLNENDIKKFIEKVRRISVKLHRKSEFIEFISNLPYKERLINNFIIMDGLSESFDTKNIKQNKGEPPSYLG